MKVAYVQDWFTVDGGAEKVTREILGLFPQADLFSLIDFMDDETRKDVLGGRRGRTSFLQRMPFVKSRYRWYLPLFPSAIQSLDLRAYDLIISSSYSVAKGVRKSGDQKHLCYCHSPIRYAHDLKEEYLNDLAGSNVILKPLMGAILNKIAKWDIRRSKDVDCFIANSENVRERIKRLYGRESEVIHPPVRLEEFKFGGDKEEFYLAASRQVAYKRTDAIIDAFLSMPDKKLVVTGDGPELERLKKKAVNAINIEILGLVPRTELLLLMSKAKAFINASHEDLGLSVVEALASGTPVIAYGKGGVIETTKEGFSAVYFLEQNGGAISKAVENFEKSNLASAEELRKAAEQFSGEQFRMQFKQVADRCLAS